MSRHRTLILASFAGVVGGVLPAATAAQAQYAPVIVVPGKPGVPVMMNGEDVSWAVIEGDWGLARPGQVSPTVIYRVGPQALAAPAVGPYYPSTGYAPRYGRLEVVPPANRPQPRPAESYYREWGTQSDMNAPVTTYPPFNPPEVIYGPQSGPQPHPRPRRPRP
jgi:hypothetical protein